MQPPRPINPATLQKARVALDLLGLALVEYGHNWTAEQRRAYDEADRALKREGVTTNAFNQASQ